MKVTIFSASQGSEVRLELYELLKLPPIAQEELPRSSNLCLASRLSAPATDKY